MSYVKFSYEGLREGATIPVDTAFNTAIKASADPQAYVGMGATIKGGYASLGASGDPLMGIIEAVEPVSGRKEEYAVTLGFNKTYENIPTGTTAPTSGDGLAVDGAGKVIKIAVDKPILAVAWMVDTTAKTAVIRVL